MLSICGHHRVLSTCAFHHIIILSLHSMCMLCAKSLHSCLTLWDPELLLPGSSAHGILHARILEWVTMPSSRGSSWPRVWTWISCISGRFFTFWATMEVLWVNSVPQISMSPRTQNVTLFENKIFVDIIKVRVKMSLKWTPNPLSVLIIEKKIHRDTQGRRVCEFHFSLFPPKPHTIL